jgi:hypothetical protein
MRWHSTSFAKYPGAPHAVPLPILRFAATLNMTFPMRKYDV